MINALNVIWSVGNQSCVQVLVASSGVVAELQPCCLTLSTIQDLSTGAFYFVRCRNILKLQKIQRFSFSADYKLMKTNIIFHF